MGSGPELSHSSIPNSMVVWSDRNFCPHGSIRAARSADSYRTNDLALCPSRSRIRQPRRSRSSDLSRRTLLPLCLHHPLQYFHLCCCQFSRSPSCNTSQKP